MSNTGQTVSKQDDIQYHMFSDDNGDWVCHHFYLDVVEELEQRIAELENQVEFEMNEKGLARIKRNEYAKRVNDLEIRIDDLKRGLDKIFKVVSSFNGGLTPVGCDGVIMLKVDEYNSLVSAINTAE